jgi:hypothetical protein
MLSMFADSKFMHTKTVDRLILQCQEIQLNAKQEQEMLFRAIQKRYSKILKSE